MTDQTRSATPKGRRTEISDLPVPEKDLTREEKKKVRGGFAPLPDSGSGGGATRLSIVATSGGKDSAFDEDQSK